MNLWLPYRASPPFGLNINSIKTKLVLLDHAINSVIFSESGDLSSILNITTVTHLNQQIHYYLLEPLRINSMEFGKEVFNQSIVNG